MINEAPIGIAIVDDHTLFRNGVATLMKEFTELELIFEAENGKHLQQQLQKHPHPQVILMDINMPIMDGYEATRWIKANHPQILVLALSMYEDDAAVINMIKSGASGYVLKQLKPKELLEAIKTLVQKGVFVNEIVSGKLIRSITNNDDDLKFTARELDFLKLCCSELTYREIAEQMFVSPRTVDNYREALFQKLNLKTRSGLVLYAIKHKIYQME